MRPSSLSAHARSGLRRQEVEALAALLNGPAAERLSRARSLLEALPEHRLATCVAKLAAGCCQRGAKVSPSERLRLRAAWTLGQSMWHHRPRKTGAILSSEAAFAHFRSHAALSEVECVWVLGLDARMRPLGTLEVGRGTQAHCDIDLAHMLKRCLEHDFSSVIAAHNHPSGSVAPSPEDDQLTHWLEQAFMMVGLRLLDHLVITPAHYFSYRDHNRLESEAVLLQRSLAFKR